ncbi:TIGR04282 family arsenosugar biosynthesis glycosyltransferase [Alkalithermobacter paradoxus]|uniref:2-phospho-L-lactate guanylyltransferase n=1 Tax=Alkalithermobacter paradoxus TaxID=29349 RepID=A0A1V4IBG6_9FIRM|nr:2-phospho-L-lactate guanylyltransferase [[Clostridium] thermoalcaliphilum]
MNALILMTRVPIPGKTKTRLMEILTGEECASIHTCFLFDIFNVLSKIKDNVDVYLTYTPEDEFKLMESIIPSYISVFAQQGETLGERMSNSIEYLLNNGYSKVILIGSDIPDIQSDDIIKGFDILNKNDLVLGPTFDGGYYLVGMKNIYKSIFSDNIKWGYKSVLEGTLDISNKLGISVGLAKKYKDIDTKEDLVDFWNRVKSGYFEDKISPQNTINFLRKYWGDNCYAERYIKG